MNKKKFRKKVTTGFFKKLEKYAEEKLSDAHKINIAKRTYLNHYKKDIMHAVNCGYGYGIIAEFATKDLLETSSLPKHYSFVSKEGETIHRDTKFSVAEIRKLCEDDNDA